MASTPSRSLGATEATEIVESEAAETVESEAAEIVESRDDHEQDEWSATADKPRMDPGLLMALMAGDVDGTKSRASRSLLKGETKDSQGDSALHVVASSGDSPKYLDCAEVIYDRAKHLVKAKNSNGDTPLHCAARAGNRNMVVRLIDMVKAADAAAAPAPAAASSCCTTCCCCLSSCFCYCCCSCLSSSWAAEHLADAAASASSSSTSEAVQQLLETENHMGETVLHSAIRSRDFELIQQLLREHPKLASFPEPEHPKHATATSPLYLAISSHLCLHCVGHLFENYPSFSTSGPDDQNVLHIAVSRDFYHGKERMRDTYGHLTAAVQHVLEWMSIPLKKELTEQTDIYGNTPLHLAASKDMWDKTLLTVLVHEVGLPSWILPYMPMDGPTRVLIKANEASVFQPDYEGSYPIHVAAATGRTKAVIVMLESFPSCAALRDGKGQTFLHVAVQKKMWEIVQYASHHPKLVSVLNMQDSFGETALHLAVLGGNQRIFRYLFQNRQVLLDLSNNQGQTAIELAWRQIPAGGRFYHILNPRYFIYRVLRIARAPDQGVISRTRTRTQTELEEYRSTNPSPTRTDQPEEGSRNPSPTRTDQPEEDGSRNPSLARMLYEGYTDTRDEIDKKDNEIDEEDKLYSENMTKGSQVMGILAGLITSATFAAAFNLPGGRRPAAASGLAGSSHDGETPWLAGTYAFDAFVVSITLAFICALLATIGLIYSGLDAIDYAVRRVYFNRSYRLMQSSARSLAVAFGLGIYLVMHPVSPRIATAVCVIVFGGLVVFQNFEIWQSVILLYTIWIRLGLWAALRLPIIGQREPVVPLPPLLVVQKFWSLLVIFLLPTPWVSFFYHHALISVEILVLVPLLYWAFLKIVFWRCGAGTG